MVKTAVVLLNMGGPDSLEAVEPFLCNLFSDPEILRFPLAGLIRKPLARFIASRRAPGVVEKYRAIGGKSPLREITERQGQALRAELGGEEGGWSVHVAMRYWRPRAEEAARSVLASQARRIVVLPLYPQYCRATTGSSLQDFFEALSSLVLNKFETFTVPSWCDHPLYVEALAEGLREGLERQPGATVLFSAHGVPTRLIDGGDPYLSQVQTTVRAAAARFDGTPWELAFQSRVGPVRWLEPSTPDALRRLAARGVTNVLVVPVSFVSDHLETLHEIDVEYRELAHSLGIARFGRCPSLNDRPSFIRCLAALARAGVGEGAPGG